MVSVPLTSCMCGREMKSALSLLHGDRVWGSRSGSREPCGCQQWLRQVVSVEMEEGDRSVLYLDIEATIHYSSVSATGRGAP